MRLPLCFLATLGCLSWLGGAAVARADSVTVVVRPFDGPGGARVRAAIVEALQKRSVGLIPSEDVDDAAERLGVNPAQSIGRVAISRELGLSTWITGAVERDGKLYIANVEIVNGADGQSMGLLNFEARNPRKLATTAGKALWRDGSDLVLGGRVPGSMPAADLPPDAPEEDPHDDGGRRHGWGGERDDLDEEEEQGDDDADGPSPLDAQLSMVAFSRSFSYTDDLSGLRSYDLGMGPAIGLRVNWYPAAHGGEAGIASNIGLDLRAQLAFGLDSALEDTSFPTSARAFGIGARFRIPLDDSEVAIVAGYGNRAFSIDPVSDDDGQELHPGVPSVEYSMLRIAADARFALGERWALLLGVGVLPTFGVGEIEEWFPNASAMGFEAELGVAHRLTPSLEVHAGASVERFGYSLQPALEDVGSRPIAGGALDQYIAGNLGARFVL